MKKILIIAAILALAIGLMVPATGWAFTYDSSDDVIISMTIPNIQILDMGASENDVTWVEPTAADLDAGYTVRRYATSFVVDSNQEWRVEVSPAVDEFCDSESWLEGNYTGLVVDDLFVRAHQVVTNADVTITQDAWDDVKFETAATVIELCEGNPTSDAEVLVDYKININWDTTPDAYYMKLTYTLQFGKG